MCAQYMKRVQSPMYRNGCSEVWSSEVAETYARRTETCSSGTESVTTLIYVSQSRVRWRVRVSRTQTHVLSKGMFCKSSKPSLQSDPMGWQVGSPVLDIWMVWAERDFRWSGRPDNYNVSSAHARSCKISVVNLHSYLWIPVASRPLILPLITHLRQSLGN